MMNPNARKNSPCGMMDSVTGITTSPQGLPTTIIPQGYIVRKAIADAQSGARTANTVTSIDDLECSSSFLIAATARHASNAQIAMPSAVNSLASSSSAGTKRNPCCGMVIFPNVRMKYVPGVEIQFSKKISRADIFHTSQP